MELPGRQRRDVRRVDRRRRDPHVVRHRAGPASRRCSSATAAPGWSSAPTTATSTSSTATPASDILPPFPTGDIIKGSVTVDPDGFPLVYSGSPRQLLPRDRHRPARARSSCGRSPPTRCRPTKWNNDWDGSALVIDDYLFEGGENSQFHIVKLNRGYGADGKVHGRPRSWCSTPRAGTTSCSRAIGDQRRLDRELGRHLRQHRLLRQLRRAGAGLGHQRPRRRRPTPTRVFRFWTGDDTDASIVIDEEGFLYVGVEYERGNAAAEEVGQLMKLDPPQARQPARVVGRRPDTDPAGIWATPALYDGHGHRRRPTAATCSASTGRPAPSAGSSSLPGPDVAVAGRRRRRADPGRLRRRPARLRRVRHHGRAARAVDGRARRLHRVDARRCGTGRIYVGTRAGRFFAVGD